MTFTQRGLARTNPAPSGIVAGAPVLAPGQWADIAQGLNWIVGKGECLVPWSVVAGSNSSAASTWELKFRVRPRGFAVARLWGIGIYSTSFRETPIDVTTPDGTKTYTLERTVSTGTTNTMSSSFIIHEEALASRSNAEQEITITIDVPSLDAVLITGISCYAQDRSHLEDDAVDYGIRTETIRPHEPIINVANSSARAVYDALANMDARRVSLVQWSTSEGMPAEGAFPADTLTDLPFKIQGPKLGAGATTVSVKWAVYAKMETGGTGTVALTTTTSGVSDSVSVTSAAYAWTTARTIVIACDDFAQIDGFRDDELTISLAGDSGIPSSLLVRAVSVWVDSVA